MSRQPAVIAAGHICLDIIPDLNALPVEALTSRLQPGHLVAVGPAVFSTGGPVANTGLALHRLGISTRLMGKVGQDLFGRAVMEAISKIDPQLGNGMIVDPYASTSYSIILSHPGMDRIFLHSSGANDTFSSEDIHYDEAAGADLFHFGYPPIMRGMYSNSGFELIELFRKIKGLGVITSLDLALPDPASESARADWRQILHNVLPYVDIFLPSLEEILFMLYPQEYARLYQPDSTPDTSSITPGLLHLASEELLGMGVKILGLKCGSQGLYVRTACQASLEQIPRKTWLNVRDWSDLEIWAPCFNVGVVGTTGAGDATIAGFLAGLLRGLPPHESVTTAVAVGACNVETPDALSGILSWEETRQRISTGWERLPLQIRLPGWEWDSSRSVFVYASSNQSG